MMLEDLETELVAEEVGEMRFLRMVGRRKWMMLGITGRTGLD